MKDKEVILAQFPKVTLQSNSKTKTICVILPPSLVVYTPNHNRQIIQSALRRAT